MPHKFHLYLIISIIQISDQPSFQMIYLFIYFQISGEKETQTIRVFKDDTSFKFEGLFLQIQCEKDNWALLKLSHFRPKLGSSDSRDLNN